MTQQVSSSPGEGPKRSVPSLPEHEAHFSKAGIFSLLAIIAMLLILFTGLLVHTLPQAMNPPATPTAQPYQSTAQPQSADPGPLQTPGSANTIPLQLPNSQYVVYEQQNNIYRISTQDGVPQVMSTPGYIYNRAVPPLVTPSGQLLYSGDGLWLTEIFDGTPRQIATLPAGQVITSMVLSKDGKEVAWSTAPTNGNGSINLYAGPLEDSRLIYQRSASDCPCFRAFAFMDDPAKQHNTRLLLTDDRGDHHAVQYGLWVADLSHIPIKKPKRLLDEDQPQGPLVLAPSGNTLLYSTYQGVVPTPTDGSVPEDIAALNYANSLSITTITKTPSVLGRPQVILPEQHELSNAADYHWVTTPTFSPDGRTLLYVEFSSDAQAPFARHSALYKVNISGSATEPKVGKPELVATSDSRFIELSVWLNVHILTFYADGSMYALDVKTGAVTTLALTGAYARIVTVMDEEWPS